MAQFEDLSPAGKFIQVEVEQEKEEVARESGLVTIREEKPRSNLVLAKVVAVGPFVNDAYKNASFVSFSAIVPARFDDQVSGMSYLYIHEEDIVSFK